MRKLTAKLNPINIERLIKASLDIRDFTSDNYHTEAVTALAIYANDKEAIAACRAMETLHNYFGCSNDILEIRDKIYKAIWNNLSKKEQNILIKSF